MLDIAFARILLFSNISPFHLYAAECRRMHALSTFLSAHNRLLEASFIALLQAHLLVCRVGAGKSTEIKLVCAVGSAVHR